MRLTARPDAPTAPPEDRNAPWSAERWSPPPTRDLTVDPRLRTAAELAAKAIGEPAAPPHAA